MRMNKLQLFFVFLICTCLSLPTQASNLIYIIKGKVTCEGKGIEGVMVTDGCRCVQTDASGKYSIPTLGDNRFVYICTPSGYLTERTGSIPFFYFSVDHSKKQTYNFSLKKNPKDDTSHVFIAQSDIQVTSKDELTIYQNVVDDCKQLLTHYEATDVFGIDCGDIVGDHLELYPDYLKRADQLGIPIYRAMGNHDMNYDGRTHETSYKTFEDTFGPSYYSFNKGNAHYIVVNNNFFIGRDYFYMGYLDERIFSWLDQDLSHVPEGSLVFFIMHIPSCQKEKQDAFLYNYEMIGDQMVNAGALYKILKPYKAHLITGHTHYNLNVIFSEDLMEHNTAAVCGTWWKADVCLDGTPRGYGVYEVNGDDVKWYYKSSGYPKEYQLRTYAVGSAKQYLNDVVANVWNWDKRWKVEWLEDGKLMGNMTQYTGLDPYTSVVCSDREKMVYTWIAPKATQHLFRATPKNKSAHIEIKVTDRFGEEYIQAIAQ
ncbi:calcineurin-like phosphoesterase C-terminal domain-containing protein [Bacteroides ihuae]|uniref:calcineurin-like phosphoesterase C-terminal domain-containing protein n=1 Tax=Bacteroides ihuae TaxID=1852362 RepID=UPI0008DA953C|nr:calcineurin-like phosphoesterase family protein [Bacteroides ihuae]